MIYVNNSNLPTGLFWLNETVRHNEDKNDIPNESNDFKKKGKALRLRSDSRKILKSLAYNILEHESLI
ncbi:hypothetical protein BpHYR1_025907 [Brachionus plicatilis]|uniref:Uncharacterized protein n=1 Tax=Brachionus plicatilis TaxID=10195 RepID=A0A3M7QWH2_BRAPC|nr:hypothetical protein BpHYR1_025907 [Brachionus plicatilis]